VFETEHLEGASTQSADTLCDADAQAEWQEWRHTDREQVPLLGKEGEWVGVD